METTVSRSRHFGSRRLVFLVIALALPDVLRAQTLTFRHITANDGLPGSQVNDIHRDTRGFIWISTAAGLGRYDGYGFTTYRHRRDDPGSLANSHAITVYEDRAHTLWVGSLAGLSRFDRRRDAFDNFMVREGTGYSERRSVQKLLEDRSGNFWVGTSHGLFLFDRRTGRPTLYPLPGARAPDVRELYEDTNGHVWISTDGSGLFEVTPGHAGAQRLVHDPADGSSIPANDVRALVQIGDTLWIATQSAGIAALDLRSRTLVRYQHDARVPGSLASDRVLALMRDRNNGLWIGTENRGLDFLDLSTGTFRHHRSSADDPSSLTGNSVGAIHQDATGALWVGTFTGGVSIARLNGDAIHLYRSIPGNPNSLSDNNVAGFHEDRRGRLWVATDGGGLNRLDRGSQRFTRFNTANSGLKSNAVLAVTEDSDGAIWVGSWAGGLTRIDGRTEAMTSYTTTTSSIPTDDIFSLLVDRAGRLWAGTYRHGLLLVDRRRGTFKRYSVVPAGRRSPLIWLIRELADGRLALATGDENEGLVIFDPKTARVQAFHSDPHDPATLSSNAIGALLEQRPGVLWVGTSGGLDRLTLATGRVEHFSERDGIPGSLVQGVALDHDGQLWLSTDRGVARFDPDSRTSRRFTPGDGLQGNEFVPRSYLQARDGTIFFGGTNGFNAIDPARLVKNETVPPVVITGLQLFGRPVVPGALGSPISSSITETDVVSLAHDQTVLTIEFAALDYTDPQKNQFSYKLDGVDQTWIGSGGARSATYSHLPPGDYVFRVRGSNSDGVWNDRGASLRISVAPALWQTTWVRLVITLVVLSTVTLIVSNARRRNRHLAAMNRKLTDAAERDRHTQRYLEGNVLEILDAMQRFSTGDYSVALDVQSDDTIGRLRAGLNHAVADRRRAEDELRQSQKMEAVGRLAGGVAHDFNNLLTVIKGNAELGLQDAHDETIVREELLEVQRAAERAAGLTRQLLAFSRKQILKPRTVSQNDIVTEIEEMLQRTVGENIVLRSVLGSEPLMVRADPGQLHQVVLNLVVNARDALPNGGELTIVTRHVGETELAEHSEARGPNYVALEVRDTGTGIDPAVLDRIFEPFFTTKEQGKGTGLGLSTVYGIVSQTGGYLRVTSALGQGSTFTVYLQQIEGVQEIAVPVQRVEFGASETILLVEDEDSVRALSAKVLTRAGYQVLVARHGDDALRVADQFPGHIHLLLTDVVMPGMGGRELAHRLIPLRPATRLLYVSGYTEDETVRHGVSGLKTDLLEKPFSPDALVRKVREVLDAGVEAPVTV